MKKSILFLILIFNISQVLFSQPWMQSLYQSNKKNTGTPDFYDIQNAFNAYWKDRVPGKSKGWKQFKRWENFMKPRVYPTGELPANGSWNALANNKKSKNTHTDILNGDWTSLGPDSTPTFIGTSFKYGSGRLNCVAFHPTNTNIFWVGSPSGGLWKTVDGGNSWKNTIDNMLSIGVSDIAVNPQNPNELFVATGDGDAYDTYSIGILKSQDGGETWQITGMNLKSSEKITIRRLLINPHAPNIIIAASNTGILRSENSGDTWTIVHSGYFMDIEFKPLDPTVIYATTSGNSKTSILKSIDNGKSFKQLITGINYSSVNRIKLGVTPANPMIVYALCSESSNDGFHGIYKSYNSGESWERCGIKSEQPNILGWSEDGSDIGGQGSYDLSMAISPNNENEIYVGGISIWKSTDGGNKWKLNTVWNKPYEDNYVHADHHALTFDIKTNALFSANDGGLYKRTSAGQWFDLSDGLSILQSYRLGVSATDGSILIGNQDNGCFLYKDGKWKVALDGDGMECIIDYSNSSIMYAERYNGDLRKSYNGGEDFTSILPSSTDANGAWVTPFIMHPEYSKVLYAGYSDVYKTNDGGRNWHNLSSNLIPIPNNNKLIALAIAPSDDKIIYTASMTNIWKTTDEGKSSWTNISTGLPKNAITYIAISENDPEIVWVTFSGFSDNNKVYKTVDGGSTWINYSEGLPNIPTNCIIINKNSNNALYLGTDVGVYYRNRDMTEWIAFSNGLPNVIVNEIEIQKTNNTKYLIAATYGRGVWESPISPKAKFMVNKTEVCIGSEIIFSDASYTNIDSYEWEFGKDATPQNAVGKGPHSVAYSSDGLKNINLKVTSSDGTNTETKSNFITVRHENFLSIYPNPTSGIFNLKLISTARGDINIKVYSSDKLCLSTDFAKEQDNVVIPVDMSNFTEGIYTIKINIDGEKLVKKLVVQ